MRIDALRREIDSLDRGIVELLNQRAACAHAIGEEKQQQDLVAFAPAREQEVLRAVTGHNSGPLSDEALQSIYREVISACRSLEHPITVAYWGPPASNTHVAARQRFGPKAVFNPFDSVADVFSEVEHERADFGVVPVENSTEGAVNITLDQFLEARARICAETYVQIHHCLLSREEALPAIRRLYTMPQATAQCRSWLGRHLGGVEQVNVSTTARAAELAAAEPGTAAIAGRAAAEHYGLNILVDKIEDNPHNRTRFLIIGAIQPPPTGRDKTSILFSMRHEAGALEEALAAFARHGISLTMIQSRPTRDTPFEYVFFVDVLGHVAEEGERGALSRALPELEQRCLFVKILGSYPEA